jgi:hypothetical protein
VDEGIEYVLVPDAEEVAEDAPTYPESREYIDRWSDPTCLHIKEDLLKLFKGGNPRAFLDKTYSWTRKQGIEFPEELLVERFSWLLYTNPEPEQDTESISPVHPGEIGRLEESALKEYVQKWWMYWADSLSQGWSCICSTGPRRLTSSTSIQTQNMPFSLFHAQRQTAGMPIGLKCRKGFQDIHPRKHAFT